MTPGMSRRRLTDAADADESAAGTGAVTGVLTGLGLGALAGLGVLSGVIPVIGPAIAGGTLGIILSNAAVGAGVGGLVGALVGAGVPEEHAHYYQGEFEAGRTIVTVQADGRADEAMAILRRYDAYDIDSRPDYSGTAASAANKPMDIPVRSEDMIGSRSRCGHGRGGCRRSRHRPHRALSRPSAHRDRIVGCDDRKIREPIDSTGGGATARRSARVRRRTATSPARGRRCAGSRRRAGGWPPPGRGSG